MAEVATPANTTPSDSTRLNEAENLIGELFGRLFALIGFASINTTLLTRALAFMVTIFYVALVLATVLKLDVSFKMVTSLLLGTVVTLLALMIISPVLAFLHLGLCIFIFALVVLYNKYQKEISQMIPEKIMAAGATPASTSSSDLTRLNEVGKLFGQLFGLLFPIIGFASLNTTSKEEILLARVLAFMVILYYMALMLATVLQLGVAFVMGSFLLLGTVVVFITLMIISPTIAFIYLGLWIFIFVLGVLYYKYHKEIYQMIPEKIKKLFKIPCGNENVEIPDHNLEL